MATLHVEAAATHRAEHRRPAALCTMRRPTRGAPYGGPVSFKRQVAMVTSRFWALPRARDRVVRVEWLAHQRGWA